MTFYSCSSPSHKGKSDTWFTPKNVIDALGPFDLDPCTQTKRPFDTAGFHYEHDKGLDGLELRWYGRVWLNPPYGKETRRWLDRLRVHGNGIALVFTAFETVWGQENVRSADGIYLMAGRLFFMDRNGKTHNNAGKGSCLIIYGRDNLECVKKLPGVLIRASEHWK